MEALFSVFYAVKFALTEGIDYTVMPLEGLWWADDWSVFKANGRSRWQWTMMILQPDFVPEALVHEMLAKVGEKKNLPALSLARLERFHEGPSAQMTHVGPFTEEGPTIGKLHQFIDENSRPRGKHHEIYLSDIRRAAPSKWKTIIRQPMYGTARLTP